MLVPQGLNFLAIRWRIIGLVNLVCRKIRGIENRVEFGLERRADLAQVVPEHAVEEFVGFDVGGGAQAAVGIY